MNHPTNLLNSLQRCGILLLLSWAAAVPLSGQDRLDANPSTATGSPVLVQVKGGLGVVNYGGGGQNGGLAAGFGGSVIHRRTNLLLSGRYLASDLRSMTEVGLLGGYGRQLGPFFLSAGAGVGHARAHYGPANWTIGEPEPVVRDYASIGVPVEAQATWQGRYLGIGLWHSRNFNELVPFSSTMLTLQLQLGRGQ